MPSSRGSPQTSIQTAKAPRYFAECHCMLFSHNAFEVVISAAVATICPHALVGYAGAKVANFHQITNDNNGKPAAMQRICRFISPVGVSKHHRR